MTDEWQRLSDVVSRVGEKRRTVMTRTVMTRTRKEYAADLAAETSEETVLGHVFRSMDDLDRDTFEDEDPSCLVAHLDDGVALLLTPAGAIREYDVDGSVHEWVCRKVVGDVDAEKED